MPAHDDHTLKAYYGIPDPDEPPPNYDEDEAKALFAKYATNGVVDWRRFFTDQGLHR